MKLSWLLGGLHLLAAFLGSVFAAEGESSSSRSLFHRTPREQMRELSTDRPDKTESAYTVDAGHIQLEMDLLNYFRDHSRLLGEDTVAEAWGILPLNFKVGLTDRIDVQILMEPDDHVVVKDRASGAQERVRGIGDLRGRLKINLWGNDGGKTALAVLPFIKFPTGAEGIRANDQREGGIIFPLAVALPAGVGMGWMTEIDFAADELGGGRHSNIINSITFSHDLGKKLGGYVEVFSAVGTRNGSRWIVTGDLGLTYAITDDIQLDGGINLGLTDVAPDTNVFLGLSLRF